METKENFLYVRAENSGEDVSSLNNETFVNRLETVINLTTEDTLKNMKHAVYVGETTQSESSRKRKKCEEEVVRENEEEEHKARSVKRRKQKEEKKHQIGWFVGAHCRTKYSVDNVVYEANIIQINTEEGTCRIKYVGYNNEEDVKLESLKLSKGKAARKKQFAAAAQYQTFRNHNENLTTGEQSYFTVPNDIFTNSHDSGHSTMLGFAPPPVDLGNENLTPHEDTRVMSAMLMSWYMSGYHTGYYQGLKDAASNI